ncbi:MAG: TonB-dependent receptor plug domain-containing protein [Candidatus Anammoxibacter sp.]
MRYLLVIFIVLFVYPSFCHANDVSNDKSYDQLLREMEALKKENSALKQQLSGKQKSVTTTEQSKTEEIQFIREPAPKETTPTTLQTTQAISESTSKRKTFEDEKEDIEVIVVTATRTKRSIKTVGSSITVVTREQIENSKAPLILDVLRQVAGIEVSRTQGLGGTTGIFIRGGNSDHTLVFIDGVQVNSTTSGGFNFANLTTDNIERIEILRGPQSTLYGSDAIGGVINIMTQKGGGETKVSLGTEYGTHETYRERINISGGKEKVDYSAGVSYLKTHGISNVSSGREEDGYENFTGSVRIGYDFLDDGRVDTTLRVSHSDFELDDFLKDGNNRQKTEEVFFSVKATKTFFDIWTPSILVSVNDTELEGFDPDSDAADPSALFNRFRIPTRLWRAEHQSDINVTDFDIVTLGFEYEVQEGENEGSFSKQTIYNRAVFFQNQIELFDRLNWTAGLRYDRHSEFGVHYTYRTTLSYNIENIGVHLHGSWGKGFKAPTINDLFFPNFGNPDLNPEESKGWDFGVEKEFLDGKLIMDVTYFENDFTNLIVAAVQDDGSFLAENVSKADAEGFEGMLTYRPFDWLSLIGSYTYTDTTDRDENDQLPRRPRNRATFSLNTRPIDKLNLNFSAIMVRDRINSDGSDMEDYWTANLTAKYDITKMMTGYVRFENLFDRDYEEVTGFDTLDLTMYGGIDFKF